uniref:Phosphotransferase n=2 Tax=Thermorudis TaxID=1649508 RepID=A0A7C2W7A5_9BACT
MSQLPFARPGRFFRGNLHAHSTNSDGQATPEQIVEAYRRQGYDFIAVTDHFLERYGFPITDTTALRTPGFTTLLGAELHAPALSNGELWHILAVGLPHDFAPPRPGESGPELAARAAEAGAFVGLAHPAWYCLTIDEARSVEAAHAVEVYNETCALDNDRGESWYVADLLLSEGRRLTAFGADDTHLKDDRPDAFGAWVWVRAERLEPDALLEALKTGAYYTSQGPLIHDIQLDDRELAIRCSPVSSIFVSGAGRKTMHVHGHRLTEWRCSLEPFLGSYCRVTLVDAAGKRAWSNPIWLDR